MPATPARIGFIQKEFRRVTSTTSAAKTRFGSLARESEDPIETFFDNETDAQVIADARQSLLSAERRRFRLNVTGLTEIMALSYVGAVPVGLYVDSERAANMPVLLSTITLNLGKEEANLTVWG